MVCGSYYGSERGWVFRPMIGLESVVGFMGGKNFLSGHGGRPWSVLGLGGEYLSEPDLEAPHQKLKPITHGS